MTDLKVSFTPKHGLPINSVLKITSPLEMPIRCDVKTQSAEFNSYIYCR